MSRYPPIRTYRYETLWRETDKTIGNTERIQCFGHHENILQAQCRLDRSFHGEVSQKRVALVKPFLNDVKTSFIPIERFCLKRKCLITNCLKLVFIYIRYWRKVENDVRLMQRVNYNDKLWTLEICNKKELLLSFCKMRDAFGCLACVIKCEICHDPDNNKRTSGFMRGLWAHDTDTIVVPS